MATISRTDCPHVNETEGASGKASARCEECGSASSLRVCLTCGHVGCCESQQGHNTAHARQSGHPVIRSLPLGEGSFTWCYECNAYLR